MVNIKSSSEITNKKEDTKINETENTKISETENKLQRINTIKEKSKKLKESFVKRNKLYDKNQLEDKRKMNIIYEKDFKDHLQVKLDILDNRLNILQMKYNIYKKWFDRFNITIIIMSSSLSIFEALRNEISDHVTENTPFYFVFNMIPITMSSLITCTAAIIKFKKYQDKMEHMQFTREKVILAISKLNEVKESLWFNEHKDFKGIKHKYFHDMYINYNESNSELKRHIKFNDYHKFKKIYDKQPGKEKKNKKKHLLHIV